MGSCTVRKPFRLMPARLAARIGTGEIGEAQYQRWRNQTLMYVLCSGLSPSLSASGSLKGADMRAPPGMLSRPKVAGMSASRTRLGRTLLSEQDPAREDAPQALDELGHEARLL